MVEITPTAAERERGLLDPAHLTQAVNALKEDGIVVLQGVIDPDHIAVLRERVLADVDLFVNRPDAPFNWNPGNVQQDPPPFPPFLFRDVLANDFAVQVNKELLGLGMYNGFYSGNTAMPSDRRQPVHADTGQLWPNLEIAHPPYALVVNVGLVDMSPDNGSTEIWPGTHLDTTVTISGGDIVVPDEVREARRTVSPPFQPTVPIGSVVIRDIRLWHAGMPNRTSTPRPMLAMIHFASWWHERPIRLHREAETLLSHPDLRQNATYFDGEIDYVTGVGGHMDRHADQV